MAQRYCSSLLNCRAQALVGSNPAPSAMDKIDEYINKQPSPQKEILTKIRHVIRDLLPSTEEKMSYGVPAFKQDGKTIMYAAFKHHVGIYPDPAAIQHFEKELSGYETAKGTIQFNLDKPIPYDLIKQIVTYKFSTK